MCFNVISSHVSFCIQVLFPVSNNEDFQKKSSNVHCLDKHSKKKNTTIHELGLAILR